MAANEESLLEWFLRIPFKKLHEEMFGRKASGEI